MRRTAFTVMESVVMIHCKRIAISAALVLCSALATQAEPITLRYGQAYSALRRIFALPLLVAEREGYFAREG